MVRRMLSAAALCSLLSLSHFGGVSLRACTDGTCSEQWDWCNETAEYFYGEYRECCTGFCLGPHPTWQCNNDSNQCTCRDINR